MTSVAAETSVRRPTRLLGPSFSILIAATILVIAAIWGARLHRATWDATQPIRFVGDIRNAYSQGQRAATTGLVRTYDSVAVSARRRPDGVPEYGLDYPPIRLAVAHYWFKWTQAHFPAATTWENTRDFHVPLLIWNQGLLALAAASTFGLVHMTRRWRAKHLLAKEPPLGVGFVPASIAASLVWFNAPAILIGFGWPQWDIAVPAFFLAALYAGCRNGWVLSGALIATAAMYKGQVLAGIPVLVIWPMVAGRWSALPRFALGFLAAAGVIAAPFALRSHAGLVRPEVIWFAAALLIPWLLAIGRKQAPQIRGRWWIVPATLATIACGMAGLVAAWYVGAVIGMALALVIYFAGQRLSWHYQFILPAIAITIAIWSAAIFSGASWNWLYVGLLYGPDHFNAMGMGAPSNFAMLLTQFRVARPDVVALVLPDWFFGLGGYEVTWRVLLRAIYVVGSVLCGIAMGIHFRRRNPVFLIAAATTWLLFVTFPAQIHERYILYPALASATFVALGFGWTFMHLAISIIAVLPVLQGMLSGGAHDQFLSGYMEPGFGTRLLQYVRATHPGIGWALITIALVCLWKSLDLRRPRTRAAQPSAAPEPVPGLTG